MPIAIRQGGRAVIILLAVAVAGRNR